MKNVLNIIFVCLLFVSVAGQAKDGPFPIYASVGTWATPDKSFKVQINIWTFVDHKSALMRVIVRDSNDKFYASGINLHKMDSAALNMVLTTTSGNKLQINLQPEYKLDSKDNKKYLEFKFDMFQLDSNTEPGVTNTTLNKVQ